MSRPSRLRRTVLAATVAAVTLVVSSCGAGAGGAAGVVRETITVAQPADVRSMDPVIDNQLYSVNVFHGLFDQLTAIGPAGELLPRLATEWASDATGSSWTFTIRTDATFHDGSPVTAQDVAFSFQAIIDNPESLQRIYTNNVATVTVAGEDQVRFDLKAPDAIFPRIAYYVSIVPEAVYTDLGSDGFAAAPVGSGPYTFVSYQPGVAVEMAANPAYWGGVPAVPTVRIQPVADADSRVNGLLSGSLDLASITPSQAETVRSTPGFRVEETDGNQLVYLGTNVSNPQLASPQLRQAISRAVDRATMIDTVLEGYATPAGQSAAPPVFGYDPTIQPDAFDVEQARALVAQSGYDGTPIPFEYPTTGNIGNSNEIAQAVAGYLTAAGINVELRGTDWDSFYLGWQSKSLQGLYLFQFSPSMMDVATTLNYLYGPTGNAMFSDPEIDRLIAEAAATPDETARRGVISRIWQINAEQQYVINLYTSTNLTGVNAALEWTPRSDGHLDFVSAAYGAGVEQ